MMDPLSSTISALQKVDLIPDVIPSDFYPSTLFTVTYPPPANIDGHPGSATSGREVFPGAELKREETLDEPEVSFAPMVVTLDAPPALEQAGAGISPDSNVAAGAFAAEATYTLVLTDPDAPSRAEPKYRQFRHWVIPGLKSPPSTDLTASGTTQLTALKTKPSITPYRAPGPPPGSGAHRYTFLLFQEPLGGYEVPADAPEWGAALEQRRSWDAVKFGEKYGLKLVATSYFIVHSIP